VLKAAVADLLPAEITGRRKRGFGVPLDRWFRQDLRSYVHGTLGAPDARVLAYIRPSAVQRLLREHEQGTSNHGLHLWALMTLETFLRMQEAGSL
jgi:asparagine synthase (glutamine-hydrolysing)